jgi:DDE superfamily endonuclease
MVQRWLRQDDPAIVARARRAKGAIYWGDETGLRGDDVRGRSYAPRGRTPEVRPNQKRAGVGLVSAVTNRGELRWMVVLDGALKAPVLIRFLERLADPGGGDGAQGVPDPGQLAARPSLAPSLARRAGVAGRAQRADRVVLPTRIRPGAEPRRGPACRPQAGRDPQAACSQQAGAEAQPHQPHAQAVKAAEPRAQLLPSSDGPLRRVVQVHPSRINKLGPGLRQAASLSISLPLAPYASSGVRPARAEWGRAAL